MQALVFTNQPYLSFLCYGMCMVADLRGVSPVLVDLSAAGQHLYELGQVILGLLQFPTTDFFGSLAKSDNELISVPAKY